MLWKLNFLVRDSSPWGVLSHVGRIRKSRFVQGLSCQDQFPKLWFHLFDPSSYFCISGGSETQRHLLTRLSCLCPSQCSDIGCVASSRVLGYTHTKQILVQIYTSYLTEYSRKLRNEEPQNLYCSPRIILASNLSSMRRNGSCSTH